MRNPILFVDVDTQHDFMDPGGALAVPGAPDMVDTLERLTALARRKGIPVLATQDTHRQDDPEFERFPPHCVEFTPGWEKINATRFSGGEIFNKTTLDIFTNPRFEQRITELAPDLVVVYGVATEYCLLAAVKGLLDRVPRVVVAEDAIRAVSEAEGSQAIEVMKRAGAEFLDEDAVRDLVNDVLG